MKELSNNGKNNLDYINVTKSISSSNYRLKRNLLIIILIIFAACLFIGTYIYTYEEQNISYKGTLV
jgi:hypothetical protein